MDAKELAKQYFGAYENEDTIHITSDGQVFLPANSHDAYNHQRSIDESKKVVTISRKQLNDDGTVDGLDDETEDDGDGVPDKNWTMKDITEWLKALNITVEKGMKKDDLLAKVQEVIAAKAGDK